MLLIGIDDSEAAVSQLRYVAARVSSGLSPRLSLEMSLGQRPKWSATMLSVMFLPDHGPYPPPAVSRGRCCGSTVHALDRSVRREVRPHRRHRKWKWKWLRLNHRSRDVTTPTTPSPHRLRYIRTIRTDHDGNICILSDGQLPPKESVRNLSSEGTRADCLPQNRSGALRFHATRSDSLTGA